MKKLKEIYPEEFKKVLNIDLREEYRRELSSLEELLNEYRKFLNDSKESTQEFSLKAIKIAWQKTLQRPKSLIKFSDDSDDASDLVVLDERPSTGFKLYQNKKSLLVDKEESHRIIP